MVVDSMISIKRKKSYNNNGQILGREAGTSCLLIRDNVIRIFVYCLLSVAQLEITNSRKGMPEYIINKQDFKSSLHKFLLAIIYIPQNSQWRKRLKRSYKPKMNQSPVYKRLVYKFYFLT